MLQCNKNVTTDIDIYSCAFELIFGHRGRSVKLKLPHKMTGILCGSFNIDGLRRENTPLNGF